MQFITGIRQVCTVVRDCDAAIRQMYDVAGIGPWAVWDFEPPILTQTKLRGVPTDFTMRLALAWAEGFTWEVIQPLSGRSVYQEFLDERGEGLHHVMAMSEGRSYEEILAEFAARGCPPAMEGNIAGADFAYIDTEGPIKFTMEISKRSPNLKLPPPKYWYPHPLPEIPTVSYVSSGAPKADA